MGTRRPRLWETDENVGANKMEIAFHLGLSVSKFDEVRPKLEAEGMPKPDKITGTWCVPAVDDWWKARHHAGEARSGIAGKIEKWRKSA